MVYCEGNVDNVAKPLASALLIFHHSKATAPDLCHLRGSVAFLLVALLRGAAQ